MPLSHEKFVKLEKLLPGKTEEDATKLALEMGVVIIVKIRGGKQVMEEELTEPEQETIIVEIENNEVCKVRKPIV